MRIGEPARRADATVKAVRYYESLGLIVPGRLANGYRDHGEDDVRLVREIRALTRLGIPVERTRPFLECLAAGRDHADDCPASLAGYRDAIDELTGRIEALTARRAALITQLNTAAHRGAPGAPPGPDGTGGENGKDGEDYLSLPAELPVPEDDGAADHLPGTRVPLISLPTTAGREVALDALGPRRTVLYVHPLTGRPGTDLPAGWASIPPAKFVEGRLRAVVGVELVISRIEAKFKLSQNQPRPNAEGVVAGLEARGRDQDAALAAAVRAHNPPAADGRAGRGPAHGVPSGQADGRPSGPKLAK
ncbi:MerR family transcriptional regulator [Streptomyces sp. NPDC100445]|uniref:MerR family transcriptional regulator n=1 Tax=Streptomyces sp. NPDC100445 TaxID=3366102 RepID=UPI0038044E04